MKDAARFQHPVYLGGEITGKQTVSAVAILGPGVGAEQMDAVKRVIRQQTRKQKTRLDLHRLDVGTSGISGAFHDFAQSAHKHICRVDEPPGITFGKSDGETSGTASEIKFHHLAVRLKNAVETAQTRYFFIFGVFS
jgi:isocitrate/isopropylmalate dehydrogenase